MSAVNIFQCIGQEVPTVPEALLERLGCSYAELNQTGRGMALLSRQLKELNGEAFCRVPFCHTVEAEALGSKVTLDPVYGNRIRSFALDQLDGSITPFSSGQGRIPEVLEAIRLLKSQGERVILDVTGPFSVAVSVIEAQKFFRATRRDKAGVQALLDVIAEKNLEYMRLGIDAGVDVISLADPAGTLDILGEKTYREFSGPALLDLLLKIRDDLDHAILHLCGKASSSLEHIGAIRAERVPVEGKDYFHRILQLKTDRPGTKIIGHWCTKSRADRSEVVILDRIPWI